MELLFIPSAGSTGGGWVHQIEYFTDSEVVVLPGHPEGEPCSSIDEYVERLRDYIHQQRYQDVILIGHSMGGAIAQLYGLKYGVEIKALVLIGAGARLRVLPARLTLLKEMITDEVAWRKYLADEYSHIEPEVRQVLIEERVRIGPAVALNDYLCCDKFDIMDKVHTIKLPTLVVCGSADDRTPVKYAEYLTDRIEGATQVIIEGASHWVHLEKPKEVNQAIEAFLARLG